MSADVSRAVYDAALKRVVKASLGCSMSSADSCPFRSFRCQCRTSTLAALGLDEPPTEDEAPVRYTPAEHAEHFGYPLVAPPTESPLSNTGGLNADWSRAPTEPPKACPTSDEPLGTCAIHGNYWTDDCLRCGSGIDGGTA